MIGKPCRKTIRLKGYDYSYNGYYFVTICTKNRIPFFGDIKDGKMMLNPLGSIAKKVFMHIPNYFRDIQTDAFIIMPNHIHAIFVLTRQTKTDGIARRGLIYQTPKSGRDKSGRDKSRPYYGAVSLGTIIRFYKAKTAYLLRAQGAAEFQWQRNYYEHIIRTENSLANIRHYIQNNPMQWTNDQDNPCNFKDAL